MTHRRNLVIDHPGALLCCWRRLVGFAEGYNKLLRVHLQRKPINAIASGKTAPWRATPARKVRMLVVRGILSL